MRFKTLLAAAAIAVAAPAIANHHEGPAMDAALAMANRDGDRARDQYRHPAETLAFFRVKPGMTVVDYMPSSGWYTRVLVPYLGAKGRYIGLNPDPANSRNERMTSYFAGLPTRFEEQYPSWNLSGAPVTSLVTQGITKEMEGTVDRVLIFREMHNMLRSGALIPELARMRSLLKDDGMLGIVQHRAKPWASGDYTDGSKAYLRQKDVIGLVEAMGFELVATSEVNANPKDPADWEKGSWMLPPGYRDAPEGSEQRTRVQAVGESDRMTLLFRKR